jgi:hypothetical protein
MDLSALYNAVGAASPEPRCDEMLREAILGLLQGDNDPYAEPYAWTRDEIFDELAVVFAPTGLDATIEDMVAKNEVFVVLRTNEQGVTQRLFSLGIQELCALPAPAADTPEAPPSDEINFPDHYRAHPSGVECVQITEHMNFCRGNALKYLWRAGLKDKSSEVADLAKARWYLTREIARISAADKPKWEV